MLMNWMLLQPLGHQPFVLFRINVHQFVQVAVRDELVRTKGDVPAAKTLYVSCPPQLSSKSFSHEGFKSFPTKSGKLHSSHNDLIFIICFW